MDAFLHSSHLSDQDELCLTCMNCSSECSTIDTSEPPGVVLGNDSGLWTSADHNSILPTFTNAVSPGFVHFSSQDSVRSVFNIQSGQKLKKGLRTKTNARRQRRKQNIKETIRKDERFEFVEIEAVGVANKRSSRALADITNKPRRNQRNSGKTAPFWSLTTYPTVDNEMNRQKQLRRESITRKLEQNIKGECIVFTKQEEVDITNRIEQFLKDVEPCSQYCSESHSRIECIPISGNVHPQSLPVRYSISNHRRMSNSIPQYYVIRSESYVLEKDHESCPNLPIGTVLQKPISKLVELVAQAIDDSPDGLLQVQQVYQYLM